METRILLLPTRGRRQAKASKPCLITEQIAPPGGDPNPEIRIIPDSGTQSIPGLVLTKLDPGYSGLDSGQGFSISRGDFLRSTYTCTRYIHLLASHMCMHASTHTHTHTCTHTFV